MTTIQRQYSLPNCTLTLEGLADLSSANLSGVRPVLSTLLSAECRLLGQPQTLSGGRDFLTSLVKNVSLYAQGLLSGIPSPALKASELVHLTGISASQHRLTVSATAESATTSPAEVVLNTVQFFDLVEAIDQLLADTQTLPDLVLHLEPVSKRQAPSRQMIVQQAVPATTGAISLVVAAIALSLLPTPKVERPADTLPTQEQSGTPKASTTSPPAPTIQNPAQVQKLQQQLSARLNPGWKTPSGFPATPWSYQVSVDSTGKIVGYDGLDPASDANAKQTPLLNAIELSPTGGTKPTAEIASFKVVFKANNELDITPWQPSIVQPQPTSTPPAPSP
jgi:Domain of unknown function (DUF4335)